MTKKAIMVTIIHISLKVQQNLFVANNRKFLRISAQGIADATKNPARVLSPSELEWKTRLSFYSTTGKQKLAFQIFQKHQFGYHPDQLKDVLHGTFTLVKGVKTSSIDVFNNDEKKVGQLRVQMQEKAQKQREQFQKKIELRMLEMKAKKAQEQQDLIKKSSSMGNLAKLRSPDNLTSMYKSTMNTDKKSFGFVTINSILINIPDSIWIRAFALIKIGNKTIKTANVKSHLGQLAFMEGYKTSKGKNDSKATIQIHQFDPKNNRLTLLGISQIQLDKQKIVKKLPIFNEQDKQIGEMHINLKQAASKELMYNPSKMINPQAVLSSYDMSNMVKKSKSKVDLSRIKKNSVYGPNNDIVFSKEKRFTNYEDKQSGIVSYLTEKQRDLIFLETNNKNYRASSFGFGTKADFTKEFLQNPGVGRYQLPSIWDRY